MSTATKTANKQQSFQPRDPDNKGFLTAPQPPRIPYVPAAKEKYGIDEDAWQALVDAIFPTAKSVAGVLLALAYCKWRKLDPFKRTVHIVPMWNSNLRREVETVWPGISELRTTAFRTGSYAGCDECRFGPMIKQSFKDKVKKYKGRGDNAEEYYEDETVDVEFPEWAQMTVYRMVEGQRVAFVGPKVRWLASYGKKGKTIIPNDMWGRRTDEQLEKCAEAAALRRAFPEEMGGDLSAEEMAGQHVVDLGGSVTVESPNKAAPKRSDFKTEGAKDVQADGSVASGETEGEEEPEGHELVDETGVVVGKIADDAAYCDAVIGLWERATDLKHVDTVAENNRAELDALPKALGKKARAGYDAAKERLSKSDGKPAGGSKAAAPTDKAPTFALKNARGKVVETLPDAQLFILAFAKLMDSAELRVDAEAIYKQNAELIRTLSELAQRAIVEAYDQKLVALGQS